MMSLAPMGESDGLATCLPLDSCSCSREERDSEDCRLAYVVSAMDRCVIRNISDPPDPVRLMRVSRASSTAVSMRAAPS